MKTDNWFIFIIVVLIIIKFFGRIFCSGGNFHFVPSSWPSNSNLLNFTQHVAGANFSLHNGSFCAKCACHARKTVAVRCPRLSIA